MIKAICAFNRRPGLSLAEFKAYYEGNHVPLITRLMPFWIDYRRNYRIEGTREALGYMGDDQPGDLEFDVLTELTYANEAMYRKVMDVLADPVLGKMIADDEDQFMDRASLRVLSVDECRSAPVSD